jgi:CelD/BcsL family acetyltransferase involved in cellulose biosynthesis
MALQVRREELDRLQSEWEGLLPANHLNCVFLHPTWQRIWLDEFAAGREPHFLSVRDGERLVGIAPLLRDGGRIEFVGHYSICDYMDVIVAPSFEESFFDALLTSLADDGWTEMELRGLPAYSPTLRILPEMASARGLKVTTEDEAVCPRVALPGTWDEYLAALGKKDRHELRRKLRRLQKGGGRVEFNLLCSPEEVEGALDDFFWMHRTSRQDKSHFMGEKMEAFFRRMAVTLAAEGLVCLYMMEMDGHRVASVFTFDCGDDLSLYNSGYDPEYAHLSVGLLSKAMCLGNAIERGKGCLDFLRGSESYKYDLGAKDLTVQRCLIERG